MDILDHVPKYDNRPDTELILASENEIGNQTFLKENLNLINLYKNTKSLMFTIVQGKIVLYFLSD